MMAWLRRILFVAAALILLLTVINASWLAEAPTGGLKILAHRGVYQQFSRENLDRYTTCTATRIEPPIHDYLENTARSMFAAVRLGADMVEIDIAPTADGRIAIFHDWTLDCRTDGKGEVREKSMAELKRLDVGYGYTADGGKTFPFRGRGRGLMLSLEEALAAVPPDTPLLFNFKSKDPREAGLLASALKAAGRDVEKIGDGFYGAAAPVERIRTHYPKAWAWSLAGAKRCTKDYVLTGWTTIVPESCRNGTLIVPLNRQWLFWGWPNRLIQRMDEVGARVILTGPYHGGQPNVGLTLPEQVLKIPSSFNGYLWVEDMWTVGPALRPDDDFRMREQQDAADVALERRRAAAE